MILPEGTLVSGFTTMQGYHRHEEAFQKVLGLQGAIQSVRPGETQTVVVLDPDMTAGLSPLEKLVLADGQPSPHGGWVNGHRVTVYRD